MADNSNGDNVVRRVTKLPVVESTLGAASNAYFKIKDSNPMVTSVFNKAENAVCTAKEAVQPITDKFVGPIKKVDSFMCSGLDYVENKIPQIKLPPQEIIQHAKDTVLSSVEPAVKCVCQCAQTVAGITGFGKICEAGELCIYNKNKNKKTEDESESAKMPESTLPEHPKVGTSTKITK